MLQHNTKLLQHSLDETTQRLFSYEAHAESSLAGNETPMNGVRSKSKKRSTARGSSEHVFPHGTGNCYSARSNESGREGGNDGELEPASDKAHKAGGGEHDHAQSSAFRSVPMSDVKVIEETLAVVRTELRRVLLEKEDLDEDLVTSKQELDVTKAERDLLLRERDANSLHNAFFGLQPSASPSRRNSSEQHDKKGKTAIPYDRRLEERIEKPGDANNVTDAEDYRALAAKFARLNAVLGRSLAFTLRMFSLLMSDGLLSNLLSETEKEQTRREALECKLLELQRGAETKQSECADCMERERERDRERRESDMRIMDAKAAVLSCRADCGRLRADLANSLECLKNAGTLAGRAIRFEKTGKRAVRFRFARLAIVPAFLQLEPCTSERVSAHERSL